MKKKLSVAALVLGSTFCYGDSGSLFILTDEFEDEPLFTQLCAEAEALCEELAETLGKIEKGDFDPEGIALFDTEVEERDEVLLPWAFDEYAGNEIRSQVGKEGHIFASHADEEWGSALESNPYTPTFEGDIPFFDGASVADSIAKVAPRDEKCPCKPKPRPRPKLMESHPEEHEAVYNPVEVEEKAPQARVLKSNKSGKNRVIRRLR